MLHQSALFVLLVSCASACGRTYDPPHAITGCKGSGCIDAGKLTDSGLRPPVIADAGTRDAALATNVIDQPDAAASRDAGVAACDDGACSGYRVRGGFVSSNGRAAGALRVSEQRVSGLAMSCGDVHGARMCVRGGVR